MELVAEAMGSLLPKLGELLKEEYGLQKGVKKKIESLSRELTVVHAVLRKIGDVPPDQLDELVRLWASEVREASYDMEDMVDTFLVRVEEPNEATEPHMLLRLLKRVRRLFEKSKARRNISSQIQEIYKKLAELAARRDWYNTPDSVVTKPATTIDPRILNLYKSATELVGIEGPKDELIDMLSLGDDGGDASGPKKMKIVSVVGFGGLGKTTLAKAVYDQLKPRFKWGAFIPVGRNPDIKKVLRDLIHEFGLDKEKFMNLNMTMLDEKQLMDQLKKFVKEKRCLIVIDDIWDTKTWTFVRCALQESNCGSRLVITTRISEVAAYADEAYKIQPLSHDNSKKLLYTRIVDGEGKYFDRPSADACEKVLKKCGGVPLAIITIASLLASKPGEDWSEVYNSIGFGHKGNDHVDNTRRILSFSYYDLPSHLKACLLYLSIFPEDSIIEKNKLIWMWMAEGFISEEQGADAGVRSLFELGERYFNELINRNMIQAQETQYKGYVDACSVHDMVLDLIHQLSSEENFVTVLNGGERQKLQGSISRRLALQCVEEHNVGQLANIAVEKVRSIFASECDFCALCPRLPFLRVVEMVGCSVSVDCGKHVLDHLGSLLHLRYLRVENINKLPEVAYLRFLQTLDLRNSWMKELPEEVGLLTQLVCLRCSYQTRVPAGLIGKLTSLQELRISCGGEDAIIMQFVKELGLLKELRVLKTSICVRSESIESALLESLGCLHNIQELEILEYFSPNKGWVSSDAGRVSCRHLRVLRLHCFVFSGLPEWINSSLAPNLCYLDLLVVAMEDQDMETLAKLPELSCLILCSKSDTKSVVSIKIRTDEGVGHFRKLRFLKVDGASIWFDLRGSKYCNSSRVASSNTIMPRLESLEFGVHVRSLKDKNLQLGFDKLLGFQNLGTCSLQRVKVHVKCEGASILDVKEAEAALEHAATVHPKHPTLLAKWVGEEYIISRYQEACMEMSKAPELVTKAWKLADIIGSGQIQILRMPDPTASSSKVMRLLYTDNGLALLALSSNAVHKLWKWEHRDKNPRGKSSKSVPPVLWQPENGIPMTNDTIDGNDPKQATACTALSKNDQYLISASGGKVSLFNMMTFKVMTTFMAPPPAATFLAFYPLNSNIIAIGREDSSIQIYNVGIGEVKIVLTGHHKKITGLAFSQSMEVLVSSGADAQLCVWSIDGWEKKKSRYIKHPSNGSGALVGDTVVQFHYDGTHLLVVHESQLAIYDWQLECLCSWFPRDAPPSPISSAVYSLGCLLVYAGFRDGAIGIFDAESLMLKCRIAPSAYIPSSISRDGETVYPTVVATHPWKPNQIAVGMSDGAVHVLEPLEHAAAEVVEEAEAALEHVAAVHPKHPTLLTKRVETQYMIEISRYQEACMEMSKAPELVTKAWKLADIVGSGQIQILRMPDPTTSSSKVMRLLYTDNGLALLALSSNAVHKLWKWEHMDKNPRGKSSKSVPPVLWQPENGIPMTNDTIDGNDPKEATACTALSENDRYLISASGGKVSLFNLMTFKVMATFMAPPPAGTFLAFYPLDNNIIAIGREDSSIQIYNVRIDEVKIVLMGHHKKITGLAFSQSMEVLVSSGADAQLCVWSIDGWEKKKSRYIKHPSNGSGALVGDTVVQFHYDGMHLLVVHESQLAIYDWQLECLCSWFPRDAPPSPISSAVYSLGCLLVYAGFRDGAIGIFDVESLTLKCRIAPSAYIPSSISRDGETVYPTVVATHPWKPNQIAVGMSDGAVVVLEPLDTDDVQVGSAVTSEKRPSRDVSSSRLSSIFWLGR
ncbi:uncharacterized protein [Miscanthus floridulus]|uniref:uncharacterized protein isoform X2 n=1 Tax=Miscanthus floridulus TaxID=154761 RepID=UPI00345911F7